MHNLSTLHKDFHGAGESTTDLSTKIVQGRIPGGVAVFWNKKYDPFVNVFRLNVYWAIGLEINCNKNNFTLINIYTPYESREFEDEFLSRLATIHSFIEDNGSSSVFVVGDFNADLSDQKSLFAKHLLQFCSDGNLILSSKIFLPDNSFTYVSEAWHTTSWLDHCFCTADAHTAIDNMDIYYGMATTDHIPIVISLNVENIPLLVDKVADTNSGRLDWSNLTKEDLNRYFIETENLLSNIELPIDALLCFNMNCKNPNHSIKLCGMYDNIVAALNASSKSLSKHKNKACNIKPGWNDFVAEQNAAAREAFKLWSHAGRPRQGTLFEHKKLTNAKYKYALRFIKRHENKMRADSLARKLRDNNPYDFWKEVRVMNNCKSSLPSNIEGACEPAKIAELWREHYCNFFNCVKSNVLKVENVDSSVNMIIRSDDVYQVIGMLESNKACGIDLITAEHLKNASQRLCPLLAMCFTGFMIHGVLPDSLTSVLLVPVIKDKVGKLNCMDNY